MRKIPVSILFLSLGLSCLSLPTISATDDTEIPSTSTEPSPAPTPEVPQKPYSAFTGRILKNKVRMRLQPSLDGEILRELPANDVVLVVGENDEFYAVTAPEDLKAYIYRTFVIDGVIEGNHVNVRLQPDLNSPIIAQLNSGDHVEGITSIADKKWLEITAPPTTRFFIAKEYVKNIGAPTLVTTLKQRQTEATTLLEHATQESASELQKPFNQVNLDSATVMLNNLIREYGEDFPSEAAKGKELLVHIQEAYLNKKLANINTPSFTPNPTPTPISSTVENSGVTDQSTMNPSADSAYGSAQMTLWLPVEEQLYQEWIASNPHRSQADFYNQQAQESETIRGRIQAYKRAIKNKPGDYLLVHPTTLQPIAYLYSTRINLENQIGNDVTVEVIPRDNHEFALPAYFVLTLTQ